MTDYEDRLVRLLQYLYSLCPNTISITETKVRLMFFWAEWHHAANFKKSLTPTAWKFADSGPVAPEFTEAVINLWGNTDSHSLHAISNEEKISLEGAVQHLGILGIQQSMQEVRSLWVARQAIWHHDIPMLQMAERFDRLRTDQSVYETTKQMDRQEVLSGEYSTHYIPML